MLEYVMLLNQQTTSVLSILLHNVISFPEATPYDNIRIHHECEGKIEKSVPRIAV